ncbi:MAG: hypothetical protein QMD21_00695 [Candidatus Thermoplasmatota archaeon]|nr:hypothetical protein [Candidatus Thermoplasmatota archaeon]
MTVLDPTRGKKKGSKIMPEMERLIRQQERIKKQTERLAAQKLKGLHGRAELTASKLTRGELARKLAEQKRLNAQDKRILKQYEAERERALAARLRGEAVTGIDLTERAKVSRELRWTGKWKRRKAKMDAVARKYVIKAEK